METVEYVLYLMLRGKSAALDIYGVCGNMYAVQYAAAEPYLGFQSSWTDERSWNFRVRLALALLDMIESIDETPYGTLYLCDIQEANFGVVSIGIKLFGHRFRQKLSVVFLAYFIFR